jgi:flagellar operon protein
MINRINNPKIQQLVETEVTRPQKSAKVSSADFATTLREAMGIKVSGHAQTRLQSRGIELGQDSWERVADGVKRAESKGSRESLIMIDEVALIVSIKNRTVITAVGKDQLQENVFTNIDSAVFV